VLQELAQRVERLEDVVGENEDVEQGVEEEVLYDGVRELKKVEGAIAETEIKHEVRKRRKK